jgi:hypothetical protein
MNKRQLRLAHRYIGIIAAFFVLLLSSTGIILNHTDTLALQKISLNNHYLLQWYGIKPPQIYHVDLHNTYISSDNVDMFFNAEKITHCSKLVNALKHHNNFLIACENALILLDSKSNIIEVIDESLGLPTPITAITEYKSNIFTKTLEHQYQLDIGMLKFELSTVELPKAQPKTPDVPQAIQEKILQQSSAYSINAERVLLDIHSGRFFGPLGIWVIDIAGVLFLLLALSGLWIWLKK